MWIVARLLGNCIYLQIAHSSPRSFSLCTRYGTESSAPAEVERRCDMMNLKDWIAAAIAIASLAINWLALRKSLPIQEEPEPEDPPGLL